MELPIDHFRLLGVSPTTDVQTLLRTLQQRLDRAPQQGFTPETLEAREALLRQSAELLSDPEHRSRYESELTALGESGQPLQASLALPSNQDVAGLLLLLEAGLPLEVFELATRALQPALAPALGSVREADLCLLASLACLAGAQDLRDQRHYESAAQLLGQGQQLLQRMGQQPAHRQAIAEALLALRPFRVLDLISRDLSAVEARSEGLGLLEELVQERGGLEGQGDLRFSAEEFQAFFRQIRAYLTVQEQIDLFDRWANPADQGSSTADFLATTALTASGFAQRKPDRIAAARDRLLASGQSDVEPLLACLHLLLGQVDAAEAAFSQGASPELQHWARQAGEEPLAQLCAYCRDWLARDVLPGYRDLEADPDLEAYFADRDVQAYLDRLDASTAPAPASEPAGAFGLAGSALPAAQALLGFGGFDRATGADADEPLADDDDDDDDGHWGPSSWPTWPPSWLEPAAERLQHWSQAVGGLRHWRPAIPPERPVVIAAAALVAALAAGGIALLRPQSSTAPTPIPVKPQAALEEQPSAEPAAQPKPAEVSPLPLNAEAPTEAQIQALLEAWLDAKAAVLAGKPSPLPLEQLARPVQIQRLEAERRDDTARNQTQRVEAKVVELTLEASSPTRVAALATIAYSDQRLDGASQPVGQPTRIPALRNRYVFGRDQGTWRLASFERAN